jgi:phosphatidylglycerol:prolipoprotein diacylglycerol transferase
MFPVLRIGPLAIQTAGLALLFGFWLALELSSRQGQRQGLPKDTVHNAGFFGALVGIVAARLGYAALHWSIYRQNPLGLIALNPQTLDPLTGLVAGGAVAVLYLNRRGGSIKEIADAAAPGLAVFMGLRALADFFSGASLGAPSRVPWAMSVFGESRHPVQLYALGFWALGTLVLWRSGRGIQASGMLFLLFVALAGAAGVLLEPFRAPRAVIVGGFRLAQMVGLVALAGSLWMMRIWWRRSVVPTERDTEGVA